MPFHKHEGVFQSGQNPQIEAMWQSAVAETAAGGGSTTLGPLYQSPSGTMSRYRRVPDGGVTQTIDNNMQQEQVIDSNANHRTIVNTRALGPAASTFASVLRDDAAVAAAAVADIAVTRPNGEDIPIAMTNAEVKNYNIQARRMQYRRAFSRTFEPCRVPFFSDN